MTRYSSRGLQGRVSEAIGRRIVSGALAEGATLDVEGVESDFGVSRTVVREAVKVLTAKGLLDARPKTGTYVLPRSSWNLLDADVMAWRGEIGLTPEFVAELDELRRMVEPWAARRAASQRTQVDIADLSAAIERMTEAFDSRLSENGSSLSAHVQADLDFHTALLRATGNELVAHMDAMLRPVLDFRDSLIPEVEQSTDFLDAHRAVYDAVVAGDPDIAERRMNELLDAASEDLQRMIARAAG
jgi:DNA-binding FadR family transcriptional regulator